MFKHMLKCLLFSLSFSFYLIKQDQILNGSKSLEFLPKEFSQFAIIEELI